MWIESVPMQVTESVSAQERERQENIFELVYTERDFVRNLDYLQQVMYGLHTFTVSRPVSLKISILVLDRASDYQRYHS